MTSLSNPVAQKLSSRSFFSVTALLLAISGFSGPSAANAATHLRSTQLPLAVRKTSDNGRVAPSFPITFNIALPLRNEGQLDTLLKRLYDPSDPMYKKFLTPAQFKLAYGPTDDSIAAIKTFAANNGLSVVDIAKNNSYVKVSGPSAQVERALNVEMHWRTDTTGRKFYAADREPTVSADMAGKILGFAGLDMAGKGHPDFVVEGSPLARAEAKVANGMSPGRPMINFTGNAGLAPNDIKKLYGFSNTAYSGSGETVAVFEQGTFYPSDPETYQQYYGLSTPTYTPVSVDGFDTDPSTHAPNPDDAEVEINLDLDMFSALAPNVKEVKVYETDDTGEEAFITECIDAFTAMANDTDRASVISVSYGESEADDITQSEAEQENTELKQMAAQGQTVCISSGDSGAFDEYGVLSADDPGVQPYVTDVGGTDLFDTTSIQYQIETAWGDYYTGLGGGGGVSAYWPIPGWQTSAFTPSENPQGSSTSRNEPDVSLFADPTNQGYDVYEADIDGWNWVGGTSAASPLWAAFFADVDQALGSQGDSPLGFANPLIYQIAEGSHYATDFNDITIGANLYYNTEPGYDNATGWGSFKGSALFTDLTAVPSITSFTPTNGVAGRAVTITGLNLTDTTALSFNGTSAPFKVVNATTVTTTVPYGATTGPIRMLVDGRLLISSATFTVLPAPTITSFSPTSGPVGTTVTVTGTNFTDVTAVSLDGYPTTYNVVSTTSLTFVVPKGASTGVIHVQTYGSDLASSSTNFTVTTSAAISSFSPTSGAPGTLVTLTGIHLSDTTALSFNGTYAKPTVVSDTKVTTTVPTGASTGPLRLISNDTLAISGGSFTVSK
jgi:kumamolisin